jgi:hypothetical protein
MKAREWIYPALVAGMIVVILVVLIGCDNPAAPAPEVTCRPVETCEVDSLRTGGMGAPNNNGGEG